MRKLDLTRLAAIARCLLRQFCKHGYHFAVRMPPRNRSDELVDCVLLLEVLAVAVPMVVAGDRA